MTASSRRSVLKGAALSLPLVALASTGAFADSTGANNGNNNGNGGSNGGGNNGGGNNNGGHNHGGHNGGNNGGSSNSNHHYPTLPNNCTPDTWRKDIPCASFTDQSNGEGRGWNWSTSVSLKLSATDCGPNGYQIQCYLVPVSDNYNRTNCAGNALARFKSISAGSCTARGFNAGYWTSPIDASGVVLPHSFNGAGGKSVGSDITLPAGSIMVQCQSLTFSSFAGYGRLNLNLQNRWFSSGQSWVKAIWVIRNIDKGHWHVLDTVGKAGAVSYGSAYDGKF